MKNFFKFTIIILLIIILVYGFSSYVNSQENFGLKRRSNSVRVLFQKACQKSFIKTKNLRNNYLRIKNSKDYGTTKKIPVLTYHHIIEQKDIDEFSWSGNQAVISVENFKEQMDYLYNNEFYIASLEELELYLNDQINLPAKSVVLTFDDGYLSNVLYAYPILKDYNFRASMFMIGYRVDSQQEEFNPAYTQALSIDLADDYKDVFSYESHTYRLHEFHDTKYPLLLSSDDELIRKDLLKNKELVGANYLAYPYGRHNDRVSRIARETGHRLAFTIKEGYVTRLSDPYRLPRISILPTTSMDDFKKIVNLEAYED